MRKAITCANEVKIWMRFFGMRGEEKYLLAAAVDPNREYGHCLAKVNLVILWNVPDFKKNKLRASCQGLPFIDCTWCVCSGPSKSVTR